MQDTHQSPDCLFCKMGSGEIHPDIVYQDDEVLAFRDLNPQAPVHILIIPRRHIPTLNDVGPEDAGLVGKLFLTARRVAEQEGVAEAGYRTLFNCNAQGGQEVFHIHLHLLGGRQMHWPPG
jgi:histidine triad (HIT) family protein